MVTVTEKAKEYLANLLEGKKTAETQGLRLAGTSGGGLGLVLDDERHGDHVVQHEGLVFSICTKPW